MALGNNRLKTQAVPSIEKLFNSRFRITRIFEKFNDEDAYENRLGTELFNAFDTEDGTTFGDGAEAARTNRAFSDARLVEQSIRYPSGGDVTKPLLIKVYETLTTSLVQESPDLVDYELNGLKRVTRVKLARAGYDHAADYEGDIGSDTITVDSTTLYLAGVNVEDSEAMVKVTEQWVEAGTLSYSVSNLSSGLLQHNYVFTVTEGSTVGAVTARREDNYEGVKTISVTTVSTSDGIGIVGETNSGTVVASTSTTITLAAGASATDDAYNNQVIHIDSGSGQGQTRIITDYNGTTKVATVGNAWSPTPGTAQSEVTSVTCVGDVAGSLNGKSFTIYDSAGSVEVWFDVTDRAEVTSVICVADVADSLDGTYFLIHDDTGSVEVWIDVDNSGTTAPGVGSRGIEVTGVVTGDTATAVATAVASAVNADSKFSATSSSGTVTITDASTGARTDASDGDTGFSVLVSTNGIGTATAPGVALRDIEVTGVSGGTSADDVATALATALDADAAFSATSSGNSVTVTDASTGARTDASDTDSGFTFTITTQGTSTTSTYEVLDYKLANSYEQNVDFLLPGVVEIASDSSQLLYGSFKFTSYFFDLTPPIEKRVNSVIVDLITTDETIQDYDYKFNGSTSQWNPSSWAKGRIDSMSADFNLSVAYPHAETRSFRGYRTGTTTSVITVGGRIFARAIENRIVCPDNVSSITVSGGPEDPEGNRYTLDIKCAPAFEGVDGTQYYRKRIVYTDV